MEMLKIHIRYVPGWTIRCRSRTLLIEIVGRIKLGSSTDDECMAAFKELCLLEGIIPALESSHALAFLEKSKTRNIRAE